MQKLKEANLYRSDLIPVSGKLIERYNQCLLKLGFEPTKLKKFSIDGIGWSPEIAEEKGEINYLNNGEANPHGIIITPFQKGKPIYVPYHTFDRELMKQVFKMHGQKINDVTRDSALCLDFDQNIDAFISPLDILKYKSVNVCFHLINNMDVIRDQQLQLIEKFNEGHNFVDEKLHQELLNSAKKHGDLRERDFDLHDIQFTTDSFYTRAFGGVYLLRDFITPILVFEDEAIHKEAIKDTEHDVMIFHISQPELVEKMREHLIVECHLDEVVETERYDRIKKFLFSRLIKDPKHPLKQILDDRVLFKSYLNRIEVAALKRITGVEIYLERLARSNQYKIHDMVADELYHALHYPHSSLTPHHQDLIWKLLVNISPLDVLYLYWYDKEVFYKLYEGWDESLKDWVIKIIKENI